MTKIEEFLRHFDDQHLANLQAAAEDGRLIYRDCCACLVHHFEGDYSTTKWLNSNHSQAARDAEFEYMMIGSGLNGIEADIRRRERLLPMIHAEWVRRAQLIPVTFEQPEKQEVLR